MSEIRKISEALRENPLEALRLYQQALTPDSHELKRRFDETMRPLVYAHAVDLSTLPRLHATARREERRRIRMATADRILELQDDPVALAKIGRRFPTLVLEGAVEQHFCCRLATDLGLRIGSASDALREKVLVPLAEALRIVLRVGAPATRDAAVEGLGGILKHFPAPAVAYAPDKELPVQREREESDEELKDRRAATAEYFDRLERRRLMVLTIAGDEQSREDFAAHLREPMADVIARLRDEPDAPGAIADALWERSDYLRILPAVARQRRFNLPQSPTEMLIAAARAIELDPRDPEDVLIAYSRYRESVFRTIDAALRRGWKWKKLDAIVAQTVESIPRTIAGSPHMCNAEIRATVAIVRTAVRLLKTAEHADSATRLAVTQLFEDLTDEATPWSNHGIIEGCYRELPALLHDPRNDDMLRAPLLKLFAQLKEVPSPRDLLGIHRRLTANACLRRILLSLTDHLQERQLFDSAGSDRDQVHRDLRVLLRSPTPENLRNACQHPGIAKTDVPSDVAAEILAGIAFESELLRRSRSMFVRWAKLTTIEKVLLTRILALQLHAISRDAPELRRDDVLRRVFIETLDVSLRDDEAMDLVWALLSSLPSDAAAAADFEIQRFVEYRGGRSGAETEDLPGYVLAMITPDASGRIAGAIAREIDLNLRRERQHDGADGAKSLYQVMLRGPDESIFDHLLPRVEDEKERATVLLFRRHVANVRRSTSNDASTDLGRILKHVNELLQDLQDTRSEVLANLRATLAMYKELASADVWNLLVSNRIMELFRNFDQLVEQTDTADRLQRKSLAAEYERRVSMLQDDVVHYMTVPIGNFSARREALMKATDVVREIERSLNEHEGLQPPERILLVALMQHFHRLFAATIRWYCDEPRRRIEEKAERDKAKDEFWLFFCDTGSKDFRVDSLRKLVSGGPEDADVVPRLAEADRVARFVRMIGNEPPPFPGQREKFEEFFVDWRADDLDVDALKERLSGRWPGWFQSFYKMVTSFSRMSVIIVSVCLWAIVMDIAGWHGAEGAGFFVLSLIAIGAAAMALTSVVHTLARRLPGKKPDQDRGYWFRCLLPRLVRLTVVPMALIVEFDHSYEFPLCGSTWVLLLLMGLSYLTTRFFVTREIVDQTERPGEVRITPAERRKVRQIVALALAHSFGIAVLLAAIFASSHAQGHACHHDDSAKHYVLEDLSLVDRLLVRFDEMPPGGHHYTRFLGFLPRDVRFDLSCLFPWWPKVQEHATFTFYPTVILTWTALGLFFGVFLEGFMKGERLRGIAKSEIEE